MITVIENRNARTTRTRAIPQSETALVLHRLWLTKRFFGYAAGERMEPLEPGSEPGSTFLF
jgi:hypothetical protein